MGDISNKYVVLDVETNGLSSLKDDLLSISIYKPYDNKVFNRFLPLELNDDVFTTHINGITKKMLKKLKPLSQQEVDEIIKNFELDRRTILIYGNLDERFLKNYFKRKKLVGFEKLNFYNFKHDIIASSFSGGNVTKDNLCNIYGINNIKTIHNGENDCFLEWQLFKKMNGNKLLITNNNVFELNDDYIIPASYLSRYPNFKYCFNSFPKFECTSQEIKKITIQTGKIKKFDTNINGMTIEHLINILLNVKKIDSRGFLLENKKKLKFIGTLPSVFNEIFMNFNDDGTITAISRKDKLLEKEINEVILKLKKNIEPLIKYIRKNIFNNEEILSQELVISKDKRVLALCDLSNQKSILEIKTFAFNLKSMQYQLYYESNGRDCYVLNIDWSKLPNRLIFIISKIEFKPKENKKEKLQKINSNKNSETFKSGKEQVYLSCIIPDYIEFVGIDERLAQLVKLHCKKCNQNWKTTYENFLNTKKCPFCSGTRNIKKDKALK